MTDEYLPGADEAAPETETPIETTALAVVRPPESAVEARDAGIAAYLSSAYQKAGTLRLTSEETKALKADFPDTAIVTGAAGKENLLYIEAPALRNRMDEVLGMGGWSHVSLRTWNEDYKTSKGTAATRVYHECVLIVRGVYITQAIGDMSYYPGNPEMNYGDAWQGSQSASLRRCLRDFGVGLQAWSKVFAKGWFERQRGAQNGSGRAAEPTPPSSATPPPKEAGTGHPGPAISPVAKPAAPKLATANTRAYVLDHLGCTEEGLPRQVLHDYLVAMGWLDADKVVEQWPYRTVPITQEEIGTLKLGMAEFSLTKKAVPPYQPHGMDPATIQAKPVDGPKPAAAPAPEPEWMKFIMPFGKSKGKPLGQFPKPELEFYRKNFVVRERVDVQQADGSVVSQALPPESIESQKQLRAALDESLVQL